MAGSQHERATAAGAGVIRATSASHPIRVDEVPIEGVAGRLGLTFAPGKRSAGVVSRVVWDRDLDTDLAVLRDENGTDVLVSLIEDHELELLGIHDLVERAEERGMHVRRFPIRDVSVPSPGAADAFDALIDQVHDDVTAGRTVTVHCRGGLGRAGLVTACVLVRLGLPADAAVERVRTHRRGAIETSEQERYVRSYEARFARLAQFSAWRKHHHER